MTQPTAIDQITSQDMVPQKSEEVFSRLSLRAYRPSAKHVQASEPERRKRKNQEIFKMKVVFKTIPLVTQGVTFLPLIKIDKTAALVTNQN